MSFETKIYVGVIILCLYICFLITSYFEKHGSKKLITPLNCVFIMGILHTVVNIYSDCIDYTRSDVFMQYAMCTCYALTGFLLLFFYGLYFLSTCEIQNEWVKKGVSIFNFAVLIINFGVTIPLLPSGLFFYVTPDCVYTRGSLFFLSYVFVFTELIVLCIVAMVCQKSIKKSFPYLVYGLLPIAAVLGITVASIPGNAIDVATALACSVLYCFSYIHERKIVVQNEIKLAEYRSDIMLSQIGPHFIYNTLSTISALCQIDPEKAQMLVDNFSDYLRENLSLAKAERLSPFDDELKHTQKYLEIEKVRFGDRVNVKYDIQISDFMLPSLSLQPIVENAVKHGITKKDEGGTVIISTYKEDNMYVVTIEDDGVGCNVKDIVPVKGHYGLFTAKERIEILLGGKITIDSEIGKGTKVKIMVKKPENNI